MIYGKPRETASVQLLEKAGKVNHYETFQIQTNPRDPKPWESLKRYDGAGPGHTNKILQKK